MGVASTRENKAIHVFTAFHAQEAQERTNPLKQHLHSKFILCSLQTLKEPGWAKNKPDYSMWTDLVKCPRVSGCHRLR